MLNERKSEHLSKPIQNLLAYDKMLGKDPKYSETACCSIRLLGNKQTTIETLLVFPVWVCSLCSKSSNTLENFC